MWDVESVMLAVMVFLAAMLYAAAGQGGGSAYLAAMALFAVPPAIMKPSALLLNIVVAGIASLKYYRQHAFSLSLFWPLFIASIPAAYLGGSVSLSNGPYHVFVGLILLYCAWHTFSSAADTLELTKPSPNALLLTGASIGLVSGLTGVGGGIFLGPLLLYFRWASPKSMASICAVFILLNSIAGLAGSLPAEFHPAMPSFIVLVLFGAYLGAEFGSARLSPEWVQRLLAGLLLLAGSRMLWRFF